MKSYILSMITLLPESASHLAVGGALGLYVYRKNGSPDASVFVLCTEPGGQDQ